VGIIPGSWVYTEAGNGLSEAMDSHLESETFLWVPNQRNLQKEHDTVFSCSWWLGIIPVGGQVLLGKKKNRPDFLLSTQDQPYSI